MKRVSLYDANSRIDSIRPPSPRDPVDTPDWRAGLIIGARRTHTSWPDCAEMTGVSVEEAKALYNKYNKYNTKKP